MEKHGKHEAGYEFAEAHPLAESADLQEAFQWAKELCAFMNDRYDDETVKAIRMDCACGPASEHAKELKAIFEKEPDPSAFVENINRLDLGFSLEYDGTSYFLIYPVCYCDCVNQIDETLPKAWCYCTVGYSKRLFETILGQEIQAELLNSVKLGDATCRIRITAQEP